MEIVRAGPLAQVAIPTSPGAVYTVPEDLIAQCSGFEIVNTTEDPITVTVWINGTTAAHQLVPPRDVAALDSWPRYRQMPLAAETILNAQASDDGCNIIVHGYEVTGPA